jgi:hypothetical protein
MPDKIYVNMTDRFMSGWGKAKNGSSFLCIECSTMEAAQAFEKAAYQRSEMKRIALSDKPRRRAGCHTSIKSEIDMGGPWLAFMPVSEKERLTKTWEKATRENA